MTRLDGEGWTLRAVGGDAPEDVRGIVVPARVPGCVHADLIRARLIDHPDRGFNEAAQQWIGRTDWRYERPFDLEAPDLAAARLEIVCDGLDTVAEIELNGAVIGRAANVHHPHRFDVRGIARAGGNALAITFRAPLVAAEEEASRLGPRPVNADGAWGHYQFLRKCACDFGWDWGPRLATSGIRRSIALRAWSGARLAAARPLVRRADARRAELDVIVEWCPDDGIGEDEIEIRAMLLDPDGTVASRAVVAAEAAERAEPAWGEHAVRIPLAVDHPRIWWPAGYGPQPLYELRLELRRGGVPIDAWRGRTGLRTVRLDTSPDEEGSRFAVLVNGVPIFCHGANWIPEGMRLGPVDATILRRRVEQARAANMNTLRVWGGGIYEDAAFYERCDELGVLVWQDVCLACAMYPEEEPIRSALEREVRYHAARLSRHPSVVLWCGGNEILDAYEHWGWRQRMDPATTWGRGYLFDLLPRTIEGVDPTRPYWPNTPYSGSPERDSQEPGHGTRHTWDRRMEEYRRLVPRFCAEFGHQSPPMRATLAEAVPAGELTIGSPAMVHRQRAGGGNERQYDEPIESWFGSPRSFAEWHYLAQLLQARSVALGVSWLRAHRPLCTGALVWQLNDAWSGHSWSMIDVAGRRKPLWHALRRAMAPRAISIHPHDGAPAAWLVNDTGESWRGELEAARRSFDGEVLEETTITFDVPERGAAGPLLLPAHLARPCVPSRELIRVVADDLRATWLFARDRDLAYPAPRFHAELRQAGDAAELHVRADTLLRDLVLMADAVDPRAEADDQLITLLPGESHVFRIQGMERPELAGLTDPETLLCANRFGTTEANESSV